MPRPTATPPLLLTAALLLVLSGAATSLAQFGSFSISQPAMSRRYYPGQRPPRAVNADEDEDDSDSIDMDEAMMGGYRGRGGQQEQDPALRPKTDLGKKLIQQDYSRSPQSVLAARATIAAKARTNAIRPAGPPKPESLGLPDANSAEGGPGNPDIMPGGDDGPDGGMPAMPAGMPENLRAMLAERMSSMGMTPPEITITPGDPSEAAPGADAPATDKPEAPTGPNAKAKAADAARAKAMAALRTAELAEKFRLLVVSGDWPGMGAFLKTEAKSDAIPIYAFVLSALASSDSALVPDEVLAISEASPGPLDDKLVTRLGAILKSVHRRGTEAGAVAVKIRQGTTHFGGTDPENRKRAASLLVAAGLTIEAVEYLAPLEQARREEDADLMNLHATYYRALAKTQKGTERQESSRKGWQLCRELLGFNYASPEQRTKALTTALAVLPEVPGDDADAWLASLFTGDPDIGWKVIDKVNTHALTLRARQAQPDERIKALTMIQRLGKAIITGSGGGGAKNIQTWRSGLDMLTLTLIDEAEYTRNSGGNTGGNEYGGYNPYGGGYGGGEQRFLPIPAERLSSVLPDAPWLAVIDPGLAAKLEVMVAATAGGSGDAAAVLDMIRPIASTDPKRAVKLAEALLSGWSNFVKPGGSTEDGSYAYSRRYSMYGGYNPYGYSGIGSGAIPLTRARQQRNLQKLGMVITDLKTLNVGPIPPKSLVDAFAISHSDAEVFRPDDIETVLGPVDQMVPEARIKLAEIMRQRLGTLWRRPQVQQEAGTKRTDTELTAEVNRGYELAASLLPDLGTPTLRGGSSPSGAQTVPGGSAVSGTPTVPGGSAVSGTPTVPGGSAVSGTPTVPGGSGESSDPQTTPRSVVLPEAWSAAALAADLNFDHAEFLYGQKADMATYTALRDQAFAGYKKAAALYADALAAGKIQPSARVFVQWFSSSLGASDLGYLTRQDRPDLNQAQQVLAAIHALPEAAQRKHIGLFATSATASMREMNPELKPRFARHAMEIIGDHPDGADLRRTVAYYDDLVKEIELALTIDGPTDVGTSAFGAQLAIYATRAVSREGGGFSKYLRNEQWNPTTGQPINYKDDLEKRLREKLSEKFDVVSITFHKPEVQPMGLKREDWEQFPLAYILLKAKDASVDRLPQLALDMDFADGQGTVILPVQSPVTLISASTASPRPAPDGLEIEQTLDDRRFAQDGVIHLEVHAKAKGLLPPLASLISLAPPTGFSAPKIDDHAASIAELDTSGAEVIPVSEQSWSLEYSPLSGVRPTAFTYPVALGKPTKAATKRYTDADIADAPATVSITPPPPSLSLIAIALGALVAIAVALFVALRLRKRNTVADAPAPIFVIPAHVTPVNAIGLLRKMHAMNGTLLPAPDQSRLAGDIETLEKRYFAPPSAGGQESSGGSAELRNLLELWIARTRQG
jgi:hypothetical protein